MKNLEEQQYQEEKNISLNANENYKCMRTPGTGEKSDCCLFKMD